MNEARQPPDSVNGHLAHPFARSETHAEEPTRIRYYNHRRVLIGRKALCTLSLARPDRDDDIVVVPSSCVMAVSCLWRSCRHCNNSLSSRKVPELKEHLRERGLPVSGKKSALVDRLLVAMEEEATTVSTSSARLSTEPGDDDVTLHHQQQQAGESSSQFDPRGGARAPAVGNGGFDMAAAEVNVGDGSPGGRSNKFDLKAIGEQRKTLHATLLSLVHKVIDEEEATNGGAIVSSRDIGRGLSRMDAPDGSGRTALACLKDRYQSLMSFLRVCNDDFIIESIGGHGEFVVFGVRRPSPGDRLSGRNSGRGRGAWRTGEDRRRGSGNMGAGGNGGSLSMRGSWSAGESDRNRGGGWGGW